MLIASIKDSLTDADLLSLRDRVIEEVTRSQARGVIMDVSGLDVVDSFAVHTFTSTALMITMRGAVTVIVGIQPEVASAMEKLGLTLHGIHIAPDLLSGMEYLRSRPPQSRVHAR